SAHAQAERHHDRRDAGEEEWSLQKQPCPRAERRREERREQHRAARRQDRECAARERDDEADIRHAQRPAVFASITAAKTARGCAPTIRWPFTMNVGVLLRPSRRPVWKSASTAAR